MPSQQPQWTNVAFIGPAQHGKSTLAGYLLYMLSEIDPKVLQEAEDAARQRGDLSRKFAFVLDRYRDERGLSQRTTKPIKPSSITPTWWGFELLGRRYMLIDTPGHVYRVSRIIGGLSEADAAVLIVEAGDFLEKRLKKQYSRPEEGHVIPGIIPQINALLSIARFYSVPQLIVCLHKMDLINFSESDYLTAKKYMQELVAASGGFDTVQYVPTAVNAKEDIGYNISQPGDIGWYKEKTFREALEALEPVPKPIDAPLSLQINQKFGGRKGKGSIRGFELVITGKVMTGKVQLKDELCIAPSLTYCRVRTIRSVDASKPLHREARWETNQISASAGQIVGLGLNITKYGQGNVSPGDLVGHSDNPPQISDRLRAEIVVLHQSYLKDLLLKRITGNFRAGFFSTGVTDIRSFSLDQGENWISVDDLEHPSEAEQLMPEDGSRFLVELTLARQAPLYLFTPNTTKGRFILLDANRFMVCGGIIREILPPKTAN